MVGTCLTGNISEPGWLALMLPGYLSCRVGASVTEDMGQAILWKRPFAVV